MVFHFHQENAPIMNHESCVTFSRIVPCLQRWRPQDFSWELSLSKGELFQANKILSSLKGKKINRIFFFSRALLAFFSPWFTIKHSNHCELQVKLLLPAMYLGLEGVAITTQLEACWWRKPQNAGPKCSTRFHMVEESSPQESGRGAN